MEHNSLEVWFRSCSFLFMGDGCRFQPLIFQGVYLVVETFLCLVSSKVCVWIDIRSSFRSRNGVATIAAPMAAPERKGGLRYEDSRS